MEEEGGKGKKKEGEKGPQGLVDTPVLEILKTPCSLRTPLPDAFGVSFARCLRRLDIGPHRALVQIDAHGFYRRILVTLFMVLLRYAHVCKSGVSLT